MIPPPSLIPQHHHFEPPTVHSMRSGASVRSIQNVATTGSEGKEDTVGSPPGTLQVVGEEGVPRFTKDRFYPSRPPERSGSVNVPRELKAETPFFANTRRSRLPQWMRRTLDRTLHPDKWRRYQEDLRRRVRCFETATDELNYQKEVVRISRPFGSPDTTPIVPSVQADPPPTATRRGRLQKSLAVSERDCVKTFRSFCSRAASRAVDWMTRGKVDSKANTLRSRSRRRTCVPIEMDSRVRTITPVAGSSSTLNRPASSPIPDPLEVSHRPRASTDKPRGKRLVKKRSGDTTHSPTTSVHRNLPLSFKKESDPSHSDHHTIGSSISSLHPVGPPSRSPSLASPHTPFSNLPSAHVEPPRLTPLDVKLPGPIDCSAFSDVGSVAGSFTSGGATLLGSVSFAHGYEKSSSRGSAPRSISEVKRQGTNTSEISGTTAASAYSGRMSAFPPGNTRKYTFGEKEGSHFILTTPTRHSRGPTEPPPDYRSSTFRGRYDEGLANERLQSSAGNPPPTNISQIPSPSFDSAWAGRRGEVMA